MHLSIVQQNTIAYYRCYSIILMEYKYSIRTMHVSIVKHNTLKLATNIIQFKL